MAGSLAAAPQAASPTLPPPPAFRSLPRHSVTADASGKKIVAKLEDRLPIPAMPQSLLDLQAVVEADKVQSRKTGGLTLTVAITNTGRQAITFYNPLDFLRVALRDKNGLTVELPPSYSRFLYDGPKSEHENDFHLEFEVGRVKMDSRTLSPQEARQHSYLLAPRMRLQLTLLIDKIVVGIQLVPVPSTPTSAASFEPHKSLGKLPAGEYRVQVQLLLAELPDNKSDRSLETGILPITLL